MIYIYYIYILDLDLKLKNLSYLFQSWTKNVLRHLGRDIDSCLLKCSRFILRQLYLLIVTCSLVMIFLKVFYFIFMFNLFYDVFVTFYCYLNQL